jgi:hypothetical protein
MVVLGWIASAIGVVGVVVSNGLAFLVWVLRSSLRGRARDLLAIPEGGLDAAIELAGTATDWIDEMAAGLGDVKAKADDLATAPVVDAAAATGLVASIDSFASGPYATVRVVYAALRERATGVGDALHGLGRSVPLLTLPELAVERLHAIDASLEDFDASVTRLSEAGAADLAQPGVAARVSEGAGAAQEKLAIVGEVVTDVGAVMQDGRRRLDETDRRISRYLTAGAVAGTLLSLFLAGLNVLLFQQGRRWSRRIP